MYLQLGNILQPEDLFLKDNICEEWTLKISQWHIGADKGCPQGCGASLIVVEHGQAEQHPCWGPEHLTLADNTGQTAKHSQGKAVTGPATALISHFGPGPAQVTNTTELCRTVGSDPAGQSPFLTALPHHRGAVSDTGSPREAWSPPPMGWHPGLALARPIPRDMPDAGAGAAPVVLLLAGAVGCPWLVRTCPAVGHPELPDPKSKVALLWASWGLLLDLFKDFLT